MLHQLKMLPSSFFPLSAAREELACDEAERPDDFRKMMELMQKMREQVR
jgi:hypothetical protein